MDVFTETPLEGNALAVLADARGLSSEEMQRIARELNLSETVFGLPPREGGDLRIRIFTPSSELPFAGHPVLGCAVALGAALGRETVTLETGIGLVPVTLARSDGRTGAGRMRQPVPSWAPYPEEPALLAALGVERSQLPIEIYTNGPRHVYVALEGEAELVALDPDMRALTALGAHGVSCFAGAGASWKTRMFAPALGVAEDPATGSAAGPLAVHLARHGLIAYGDEIEIRQGAEIGRPSLLRARVSGSRERVDRVEVAGSAVLIARGVLAPRP
jgi:trans-2,3-dihydro-3-hydroxyanthranilate isomerase